jgi:DNA-binding beta-propeller fold protein YncE
MRISLSLILCVFILSQCADAEEEESRLIKPDQIISLIHSSDLSQYTLTCTDSELIATDARSNHVYIFDYNTLEVVESFGRNGSGPGEFNGALYSVADDKSVYVYDSGNQRINVFNSDDWSYQSVISVGRNVSRFAVSSEHIYLSSPFTRTETPFMKVNMDGETGYFGEKSEHDFFGRNIFNLLIHREKIIAVSRTEPIIQFYNMQGEFLDSHDIGNEVHLTETLEFTNQFYLNSENQSSTVVLFGDAAVFDNFLVINFLSRPGGRLKTNNYFVYKIEGNTLQKVAFFETDVGTGGFTRTFCIHENKLYSNGGQGGIDIYRFDLTFLAVD